MNRRDFLSAMAALSVARLSLAMPSSGLHIFGALPEPGRVSRVFAAGAPAAVLVYAVAPDKLMGWPGFPSEEARALLAPAARGLPMLGRLAGRGSTLPLEKLVALKPDLIVDAGTVDATYLSLAERVQRQTGIPYVLVDGRLADSARQLRDCGRILGVAERGEQLARYAEATLLACRAPGLEKQAKVYLARGADGLETALRGAVNGECIEAACAVNAAPGSGGVVKVSREQVFAWAPDAIITQYAEFFALARQDAFWQRLPAVREGRLFLAPSQPFGWLDGPPSVNRLMGVRWLFERLNPGAAKTDWIAQAQEFHGLFYGHVPSKAELERMAGIA